ncbi:4241_t:CDS:2, partial [Acaulospora morrowiae]
MSDISVILSIDFGTQYSSFSYAHVLNNAVITNNDWPGVTGQPRIETALQYDSDFQNVIAWGYEALATKPTSKKYKKNKTKPIELFKLHLRDIPESQKPTLPVINNFSNYHCYLYYNNKGNLARGTITTRWPKVDFYNNVHLILTVPAEWSNREIDIMRECVFNASLIKKKDSSNLEFLTEREAVANYCMKIAKEYFNIIGKKFMIVNCGRETVDLTTRELLENELGKIASRHADFCGGSDVEQQFLRFITSKVGTSAVERLKEFNFGHYQNMIRQYSECIQSRFTGDEFFYEFDLEDACPAIKKYVSGPSRDVLEKDEWIIDFDTETVKSLFDPVIKKITELIHELNSFEPCSAIFLIGEFSESKYLQSTIKERFKSIVNHISIPPQPTCAVTRGATEYGLRKTTRTMKATSEINKLLLGETSVGKYGLGKTAHTMKATSETNKLLLGETGEGKYGLRKTAHTMKTPSEINILLLGETGVGKSTFINAFANYLRYDTLDDAK